MCKYTQTYNIFTTDESFTYCGPFGDAIFHQTNYHGFEVAFDGNYLPIIESIKGFGALEELIEDIEDCIEREKTMTDNEKYLIAEINGKINSLVSYIDDKEQMKEAMEEIKEFIAECEG